MTLKLLATLILPVLFSTSCGGDSGSGTCPAGVSIYRVADGSYQSTGSAVRQPREADDAPAEWSHPARGATSLTTAWLCGSSTRSG